MKQAITRIFSQGGVLFMRLIAPLPLPMVRALGWLLGWLAYAVAVPRRRIVRKNLLLCFPEHSAQEMDRLEVKIFIYFAQAWLDRSWLWHGSKAQLEARLQLTGDAPSLAQSSDACVLFAPHFMGLDAGWTALNSQLQTQRRFNTIYTRQRNPITNHWIIEGRRKHGDAHLFTRNEGVREIAHSLKRGEPLYLLPDMDLGASHSVFVPFFKVTTATVPSLSRFAKLGAAQVRSVQTLITPQGYRVTISPPWANYPSTDLLADTARMNQELEALILDAPEQYYWVHKRFKTRPPGEVSLY